MLGLPVFLSSFLSFSENYFGKEKYKINETRHTLGVEEPQDPKIRQISSCHSLEEWQ